MPAPAARLIHGLPVTTTSENETSIRSDIGAIDSELRLVAVLRRAARDRGGRLPSIGVADALLNEPTTAGIAGHREPLRHNHSDNKRELSKTRGRKTRCVGSNPAGAEMFDVVAAGPFAGVGS